MEHVLHIQILQQSKKGHIDQTLNFNADTCIGAETFKPYLDPEHQVWLDNRHCMLSKNNVQGSIFWCIKRLSLHLGCTVNDLPLKVGEVVRLNKGDVIELGLVRLKVTDGQHQITNPLQDKLEPVIAPLSTAGVTQKESTDLSEASFNDLLGYKPSLDPDANPFEILPQLIQADANAQHNQPITPISLLDDLPKPLKFVIPTDSTLEQLSTSELMGVKPSTPQDVLDKLAQEYVAVIKDPQALYKMAHHAIDPNLFKYNNQEDVFSQLAPVDQADSLEDTLLGKLSVDTVINRLGDDDRSEETMPQSEDVLQLFADGITLDKNIHTVPELTRKDHHAFSLDSHYASVNLPKVTTTEKD